MYNIEPMFWIGNLIIWSAVLYAFFRFEQKGDK